MGLTSAQKRKLGFSKVHKSDPSVMTPRRRLQALESKSQAVESRTLEEVASGKKGSRKSRVKPAVKA